jgi:hypothetical protein
MKNRCDSSKGKLRGETREKLCDTALVHQECPSSKQEETMDKRIAITRRQFLKASAGVFVASQLRTLPTFADIPGGTLPLTSIPKYVAALVIPPVMSVSDSSGAIDY